MQRKVSTVVAFWLLVISGLHAWLNVNWEPLLNERLPEDQRKITFGYIPVT